MQLILKQDEAIFKHIDMDDKNQTEIVLKIIGDDIIPVIPDQYDQ